VRPVGAGTETDAERLLADALAGWQERHPAVTASPLLLTGHPAMELVRAAADARLLVVGSRGISGTPGITLGSVSHTALLHATCAVAVTHAAAAAHRTSARAVSR